MLNAGRSSGSRVVAIAVAGTIAVAGFGTIYLPFIADRDQMRGLDEDGGLSKKDRMAMQAYLKKEQQEAPEDPAAKGPKPGSMWSNMRK